MPSTYGHLNEIYLPTSNAIDSVIILGIPGNKLPGCTTPVRITIAVNEIDVDLYLIDFSFLSYINEINLPHCLSGD